MKSKKKKNTIVLDGTGWGRSQRWGETYVYTLYKYEMLCTRRASLIYTVMYIRWRSRSCSLSVSAGRTFYHMANAAPSSLLETGVVWRCERVTLLAGRNSSHDLGLAVLRSCEEIRGRSFHFDVLLERERRIERGRWETLGSIKRQKNNKLASLDHVTRLKALGDTKAATPGLRVSASNLIFHAAGQLFPPRCNFHLSIRISFQVIRIQWFLTNEPNSTRWSCFTLVLSFWVKWVDKYCTA